MSKKRLLAAVFFTAAAGLLAISAVFFAGAYLENRKVKKEYAALRDACLDQGKEEDKDKDKDKDTSQKLPKEQENGEGMEKSQKTAARKKIKESFGISWEKLWEINPETVAWIEVPGGDISYPVVQGEDNEYYLTHSFAKEEDAFGAVFLEAGNRKSFRDSHSFLYGHNMEGGMMFANLNRYEKREFLVQCPQFFIYTPSRMYCYDIFSVQEAWEKDGAFEYGYALRSQEYQTQLALLLANSLYDTGVLPDADKPMVTLVTCNSRLEEHVRMTVHGICREVVKWKDIKE